MRVQTKGICASALLAVILASPSTAAEVEFRGAFCVLTTTAQCTVPGWVAGCHVNFRFSPRLLGDNGPQTRLSLFDGFLSANYTMASGSPYGTVLLPVAGTRFGRGVSTFNAQWKITTQQPTPAALIATSQSVTFRGAITSFDNIPGCSITFKAAGINGAIP
jgi:hypothetical protein